MSRLLYVNYNITLRFFCIWVRVDRGYELTWVRVDRGYELTWVRVNLVRVDFGYELTVNDVTHVIASRRPRSSAANHQGDVGEFHIV